MDRPAPDVAENQIDRLVALGWLAERPSHAPGAPFVDPFGDAPLDDRARAYLDGNCGHCHAPGREAARTEVYWDWGHTQADLSLCVPSERVGTAEHVVVPGDPERSTIITRMRAKEPFFRMPLGANHVPDERGLGVLEEWIASMPRRACP